MVGQKTAAQKEKENAKMHRRSRTGCFTCRLRRKKCDEGKPACKACKHLGLKCEYKRPMWWSNNEQRRQQKEVIKNIIKRTKLSEKSTQMAPRSSQSPPGLSCSVPTSDTYSDSMTLTRAPSVDSQLSLGYDFNQTPCMPQEFDTFATPMQPLHYPPGYPCYSPYEVDIKTERQMYVNDVPTRCDSSTSTFSTFQPPPPHHSLSSFPVDNWIQEDVYEVKGESMAEEPLDFNFFEYPHGHLTPTRPAVIEVEDCDRPLLDHFIENVLQIIFPILEVNQHGSARSDVILPALQSNKCYLHCCLSVSALHLKTTERLSGEQIDSDIMRHRYATISELCEALTLDKDHHQILEATLGMIFFQCSVGRPDDGLPDIPWHQHFQAGSELIQKLELPRVFLETDSSSQPPFNMTLASWIDILGATMIGRAPVFANTYREKHLTSLGSGLCELMGCEDRVMYLISEIACLDALKLNGMDGVTLCSHITLLAEQVSLTEPGPGSVANPYSATGAIRPRQLSKNMTAIYRLAARIYLCSLVPGFDRYSSSCTSLVDMLAECLEYIPSGPEGFDRSLVWPLLIAGGVSIPSSPFRTVLAERRQRMGEQADFGSFGRMARLLQEVWQLADASRCGEEHEHDEHCNAHVHWRDVMKQNGWDFLLI
ncbi:MAG: hypothetical protein M1819_006311 [Sarea resinae]|nr:MAG: hypothetical protein M1819_006311 [Sarea resinae]